jgi:large repetitive protein
MVLVLTVTLAVLAGALATLTSTSLRSSNVTDRIVRATAVAESGARWAIARLPGQCPATAEPAEAEVNGVRPVVTCQTADNDTFYVFSTASIEGLSRTVEAVWQVGIGLVSWVIVGSPTDFTLPQPPITGTPGAPTLLTAVGGDTIATVDFVAPVDPGTSAITNYEYSVDGGNTWNTRSPASTESPLVIDGLTNDVEYIVALRAVNSNGPGTASDTLPVTPTDPPPGAPTITEVVPGPGTISVTFDPPVLSPGNVTNYQYSVDDGSSWTTRAPASVESPLVITGLTNGETYTVRIRAVRGAIAGSASNEAVITLGAVPGAPTLVSATGGNTLISIVLEAPESDGGSEIIGYEYRLDSGDWTATGQGTAVEFDITDVANGTTYSVSVRAVNLYGESAASNAISVRPLAPPDPPTNLVASVRTSRSVNLTWTAPVGELNGYVVERSTGGGSFSAIGLTSETSYLDTGLTTGNEYLYRVSAANDAGTSGFSNIASATPTVQCPVALSTATYSTSSTGTTHSVTMPAGIEIGDRLIMVLRPGGTATATRPTGWDEVLSRSDSGVTYIWTRVAEVSDVDATASSVTISSSSVSLSAVTYRFADAGVPSATSSRWSTNPPESPTGANTTNVFIAGITHRRTNNTTTAAPTNYDDLLRAADGSRSNTSYTGIVTATRCRTAASDDPGGFTTTVSNSSSNDDRAHSLTILVPPRPVAPGAPTALAATASSSSAIGLTWNAPTGVVTGYRVERSTDGVTFAEIGTPSTTSYADSGLTPATTYFYRVRGQNETELGPYSATASATTEDAPASFTATLYFLDSSGTLPGGMSTTNQSTNRNKTIAKDGAAVNSQTDTSKFHVWSYTVPTDGITIAGNVSAYITTGSSSHGVTAGLFDCPSGSNANSNSCTLVSTATTSSGLTGTSSRTLDFGTVNRTIAAGRLLRVKIVNRDNISANDFTAYWGSTTYPSRLVISSS